MSINMPTNTGVFFVTVRLTTHTQTESLNRINDLSAEVIF